MPKKANVDNNLEQEKKENIEEGKKSKLKKVLAKQIVKKV